MSEDKAASPAPALAYSSSVAAQTTGTTALMLYRSFRDLKPPEERQGD
jgi:hypothetical protein